MIKNRYDVIGIMSGTSLDGIDLAYVSFIYNDRLEYKIHKTVTVPYQPEWIQKLQSLVALSFDDLKLLDEVYTDYLSEIVVDFIRRNKIEKLDAVCSHGHTALHQPDKGLTYQIGNLPKIATNINELAVCDFRVDDVLLGGQGAPLVPIGDELLFSNYDFCLNLGGFANISTKIDGERIAYDICPVNIVLNHYVHQLGFDYDNKGKLASTGSINKGLLEKLNAFQFYKQHPPKSLGLEWVKSEVFPLIDSFQLDVIDILRTFIEHISIQISKNIFSGFEASVLCTGGGAYNDFLIKRIKNHTVSSLLIPSKELIEFKEALVFGFLGVRKLRNEINCLKSVTGAAKDHSSGKVYCP
ncbi:anhydro-N-acetylmuramic acid kinase [Subsaxibacter sp. CAU 1640]|uniref:anhydro-N-acetylmuramic acid kinase n=1 Tax=Subsaxibacter sp. CAU 1640 TaxID=2933271 RepID=UPI002003E0D2|nr:anhydro-N-acetylmuramic acid kinase [Subsaxibacter sp. CAU 1640]MCK7591838.1 anhydro-N-acetylmuramic acid kinase [Subsaxibacter sp. CAU 1640]